MTRYIHLVRMQYRGALPVLLFALNLATRKKFNSLNMLVTVEFMVSAV